MAVFQYIFCYFLVIFQTIQVAFQLNRPFRGLQVLMQSSLTIMLQEKRLLSHLIRQYFENHSERCNV